MQYNSHRQDEALIDLGDANASTQGAVIGELDTFGLPQTAMGISDD